MFNSNIPEERENKFHFEISFKNPVTPEEQERVIEAVGKCLLPLTNDQVGHKIFIKLITDTVRHIYRCNSGEGCATVLRLDNLLYFRVMGKSHQALAGKGLRHIKNICQKFINYKSHTFDVVSDFRSGFSYHGFWVFKA